MKQLFLAQIAQFSWKIQLKNMLKQFLLKFFIMFQLSYKHAIWLKRCAKTYTVQRIKYCNWKTYEYIFNYTFVYAWAEILRKPIKIALKWIKQLYLTILSNLNVYTSHQNVIKLISKYFIKYFVLQKCKRNNFGIIFER